MKLAITSVTLIIVLNGTTLAWSAPQPSRPAEQGDHKPLREQENSGPFLALTFLPNSDLLVLGGGALAPGKLAICEIRTLKELLTRTDHTLAIWSVAASPDGTRIATGGGFGEVKVYDAKSGKVLANLDGGGEYTHAIAFTSDGSLFANAAAESVKIWDGKTMKELASVPDVKTAPNGLAFSPDNKLLAIGDRDEVRFWDVAKGREAFKAPYEFVNALLFSRDGKYLVVSGVAHDDPSLIRVWDVEKKKEVRTLKGHASKFNGHRAAVIALAIDKNGKYLVSGGGDETVRIWDFATGRELCCLSGNKEIVRSIAISDGDKYLAICSDKLIRVWDFQELLKNAAQGIKK